MPSSAYPEYSEAQYFADQTGVFEITKAQDPSHGNVMRQVWFLMPYSYIMERIIFTLERLSNNR